MMTGAVKGNPEGNPEATARSPVRVGSDQHSNGVVHPSRNVMTSLPPTW